MIARIAAYPGPRPSISLAIEFENAGAGDWTGTVFEPVVPLDPRAWVDGEEVAVRQPLLDLGVQPRRLRLGPGERTELPSPIVLVFEEADPGPDDPFVWVLGAPPAAAVELEVTVEVDGERLRAERTVVQLPPAAA